MLAALPKGSNVPICHRPSSHEHMSLGSLRINCLGPEGLSRAYCYNFRDNLIAICTSISAMVKCPLLLQLLTLRILLRGFLGALDHDSSVLRKTSLEGALLVMSIGILRSCRRSSVKRYIFPSFQLPSHSPLTMEPMSGRVQLAPQLAPAGGYLCAVKIEATPPRNPYYFDDSQVVLKASQITWHPRLLITHSSKG